MIVPEQRWTNTKADDEERGSQNHNFGADVELFGCYESGSTEDRTREREGQIKSRRSYRNQKLAVSWAWFFVNIHIARAG